MFECHRLRKNFAVLKRWWASSSAYWPDYTASYYLRNDGSVGTGSRTDSDNVFSTSVYRAITSAAQAGQTTGTSSRSFGRKLSAIKLKVRLSTSGVRNNNYVGFTCNSILIINFRKDGTSVGGVTCYNRIVETNLGSTTTRYISITGSATRVTITNGTQYDVKITSVGNIITLYVNGVKVQSINADYNSVSMSEEVTAYVYDRSGTPNGSGSASMTIEDFIVDNSI